MKISPWIEIDHCATRVFEGTDPFMVKNRVAFIEKTPRVCVQSVVLDYPNEFETGIIKRVWVYGPEGSGELCGKDPKSRKWCDDMLVLLGYEFAEGYEI